MVPVHMVTKEGRSAVLKSISTPERAMEAVSTVCETAQ
jgi:hypothetical protein